MNILFYLIAIVLAVWRISKMITAETGAWRMFEKLRDWAGVEYVDSFTEISVLDTSDPESPFPSVTYINAVEMLPSKAQPTTLAEGITCLWCTSLWVAGALGLLWLVVGLELTAVAAAIPALSAAAIIVDSFID